MQRKQKKTPTGGRKIPRAYRRITVVPPHRVAIVYPPLEVMRQAVKQTNKRKKQHKTSIKIRNENKTDRTDQTKQADSPPPQQSYFS